MSEAPQLPSEQAMKAQGSASGESEGSPHPAPPSGLGVILAERRRQIEKGHSPEYDDEHDAGELALCAALYALPYDAEIIPGEKLLTQDDFIGLHIALETGCNFFVKPEPDNLKRLAKAGALIVAEIERIQRASAVSGDTNDGTESSLQPESEYQRGRDDERRRIREAVERINPGTATLMDGLFLCEVLAIIDVGERTGE